MSANGRGAGGTHMQPLISLKGVVKSYKRGRQTVGVLHKGALAAETEAAA
jgi:hypothetical protein